MVNYKSNFEIKFINFPLKLPATFSDAISFSFNIFWFSTQYIQKKNDRLIRSLIFHFLLLKDNFFTIEMNHQFDHINASFRKFFIENTASIKNFCFHLNKK